MKSVDVAIVGAGFGGLGAGLALVERGAEVVLFERLRYPGGCASTFRRRGARFESGATLFSGFGDGQLFAEWIRRHRMDVTIDFLDPVVTIRAGSEHPIPASRELHVRRFVEMAPSRAAAIHSFFEEQRRVADCLWALFSDARLLPPFGLGALLTHLGRAPRYLPLLRWVGRPLLDVVRAHGLADLEPLRTFLDAVSQITVQASAAEAEAPFALATMDYFFRGTGHVRGGIGELAHAVARAIEGGGGEVRMPDEVQRLERVDGRWRVHSRKGSVEAKTLVANLLPQDLGKLLPPDVKPHRRLRRLARAVEGGWGAAMRYLVVEPDALEGDGAHHLELIDDPAAPFLDGNHLFCSISARAEERAADGGRTVTVSTHVRRDVADDPAYQDAVQRRMTQTLRRRAPELLDAARWQMTASPRTFTRFTGRHRGFVGGVPRRRGLHNYRDMWPAPVAPDVYLVGDSVFPGQSTLATALGGVKLADHLAGRPVRERSPRLLPA